MRRFRAGEGRVLTLPQGLKAGPGATNMRLAGDQIVDLDWDDPVVRSHQRFVAIALGNGDLVELEATDEPAPLPPAPPAPPRAPLPFTVNPPKE